MVFEHTLKRPPIILRIIIAAMETTILKKNKNKQLTQ